MPLRLPLRQIVLPARRPSSKPGFLCAIFFSKILSKAEKVNAVVRKCVVLYKEVGRQNFRNLEKKVAPRLRRKKPLCCNRIKDFLQAFGVKFRWWLGVHWWQFRTSDVFRKFQKFPDVFRLVRSDSDALGPIRTYSVWLRCVQNRLEGFVHIWQLPICFGKGNSTWRYRQGKTFTQICFRFFSKHIFQKHIFAKKPFPENIFRKIN